MDQMVKGSTSQTVEIFIQDSASTVGAGKTGLVFNTASLIGYYVRTRGSATAITLATLAAANSAFSSGGFKEVDATNMPGVYRLDIPNAALAAGADFVDIMLSGATGMAPVVKRIQLTGCDVNDAVSLGLSRIDIVLSTLGTAANLALVKAKTDQLTFTIANKVDAAIVSAASLTQAAADKVWDTAARTLTSLGFSVTVGTNNDKTGYSLSTAGILAIWHQLTSAIATAGSIGKLLKDNVDAVLSTLATAANLSTLTGYVDTEVAAIKAITDQFVFTTPNRVDATITGSVTVGTNNDKTGYALSSAGIDAILDDAPSAELAAIPTTTSSLRLMIQFLFTYFRNKKTVTATTETLFKEDASISLGTATLSDSGGTVTKGEMN